MYRHYPRESEVFHGASACRSWSSALVHHPDAPQPKRSQWLSWLERPPGVAELPPRDRWTRVDRKVNNSLTTALADLVPGIPGQIESFERQGAQVASRAETTTKRQSLAKREAESSGP